ncbi:MAG TPA: signal peptidase I [Gammaproteobacteria bacterium]|nr:signal peptidase I [Gammaproteobacteria bacterium]
MHFDLELVLVIGSVFTGLVWLADKLWLRRLRLESASTMTVGQAGGSAGAVHANSSLEDPWYVEYSKSFFPVLLIVLILRSFIAEPFRIPSGSMMPTLLVGDFILVNKFSYGVRLPVIHTKILDLGGPERGDVIVFRWPRDPRLDYIKRVIGVPGDRIRYVDKELFVNGQLVNKALDEQYHGKGRYNQRHEFEFTEDLMGVKHHILLNRDRRNLNGEYVVPDGHYFVMGDNRDNSNDSRFWGFVPEENLVGRAMLIWMNWDFSGSSVDFSRIGTKIR